MRRPGKMERAFGGRDMGGLIGGSIFGSLVEGLVGSMITEQFFNSLDDVYFGQQDLRASWERADRHTAAWAMTTAATWAVASGVETSAGTSSRDRPLPCRWSPNSG